MADANTVIAIQARAASPATEGCGPASRPAETVVSPTAGLAISRVACSLVVTIERAARL